MARFDDTSGYDPAAAAMAKQMTKLSKREIKNLGGEAYTSKAKAKGGGSKANLYKDANGNIYTRLNGSNHYELWD